MASIAMLKDQRVYTNTRRCKWITFNFQTWPGFEARSKSWNMLRLILFDAMLDSPGQFQSVQASEVGDNLTSTTGSAVGENLTSTESGFSARHFLRGIKLEEDWCVWSADIWRKTSAFERLALIYIYIYMFSYLPVCQAKNVETGPHVFFLINIPLAMTKTTNQFSDWTLIHDTLNPWTTLTLW